jgi:1-acyl-sn-glycerol-3-phosphate acyltransferase
MTALLLSAGVLLALAAWFAFWFWQACQFQKSGHTPPESSWFAKLAYFGMGRLASLLTVGPVEVIGKENMPRRGRVVLLANHQFPVDFAMVLRGTGRHYRALGDANQFAGLFGVIAAWVGNISVTFKTKEDRAAGEAASVAVLAKKLCGLRLNAKMAIFLASIAAGAALYFYLHAMPLAALASFLALCVIGGLPGGDPVLTIAPQGALMPENTMEKEEFRAGAIRIARAAQDKCGEPVHIVPMAICYKRDPKDMHWSHHLFRCTRRLFPSIRNPKYFNPAFKVKLEELPEQARAKVAEMRAEAMRVYKEELATIYGAVVVVGEPIDPRSLPDDPLEAIDHVRRRIIALHEQACPHKTMNAH